LMNGDRDYTGITRLAGKPSNFSCQWPTHLTPNDASL